jgi:iron(II)-dependent oxidoreductase
MASLRVAPSDALLSRLADVRMRTDDLFRLLRPEALFDRPIAERHRNIFYLGHLEAFDWNLLSGRALGLKSFHPEFDKLFAFGIDPLGDGLPSDQPQDWPSVREIGDYNQQVRERLDAALGKAMPSSKSLKEESSLSTLLNVAIEHRLMHAETLVYLFHQLPFQRKAASPLPQSPSSRGTPVKHRMVEIPSGEATLGLPREEIFGWDNEFEIHRVAVPAFVLDAYSVTNGDYLRFIQAGGYENRSLWTDESWGWITRFGVRHPVFWTKNGNDWFYRTMFCETPLPLDWPVYVSHAEASAYARWVKKALPTEAEWHRAALGVPGGGERLFPWGSEAPSTAFGNFDFRQWDPSPVGSHPRSTSAFGVTDMVGNGWEWTATAFSPFPEFKPFSFYPGYSANFFDGKHFVMKGGSSRTAACMLRRSFRNWFQAHYPYVYAKFRCVAR